MHELGVELQSALLQIRNLSVKLKKGQAYMKNYYIVIVSVLHFSATSNEDFCV